MGVGVKQELDLAHSSSCFTPFQELIPMPNGKDGKSTARLHCTLWPGALDSPVRLPTLLYVPTASQTSQAAKSRE